VVGHCSHMPVKREEGNFRVVPQRTRFEVVFGAEAADNLVVD